MARKPTFAGGMTRRENSAPSRDLRLRGKRAALPDALPVVHATTVFGVREIVKAERLQARRCDVFERDLVYFFVMRPAYRSRFSSQTHDKLSIFPVVLVLPPTHLPVPFHVYPLDTGGAAKGAFKTQADPLIPLEDYALVETLEAASAHIEWAFGDIETYLNGDIRLDLSEEVEEHDIVTRGYIDVARMGRKQSNEFDRRASAVEVAFSADIALAGRKGLVIVPSKLLGDKELVLRLESFGFHVEAYDWRPNTAPDDYDDDITDLARQWYRDNDWLKP